MTNKPSKGLNKKPDSASSVSSKGSSDSAGSVGCGQTYEQTNSAEDVALMHRLVKLRQINDNEKAPQHPCYDVVAVLVTCREHHRIATRKLLATPKLYWLPFLATVGNKLHTEALQIAIRNILQRQDGGMTITRSVSEVPHTSQLIDWASFQNECGIWFERHVYWVHIKKCVKDVCQNDVFSKVEWHSIDNVLSSVDSCWGRDMLRLIEKIKPHLEQPATIEIPFHLEEFEYEANFPSGALTENFCAGNPFIALFQSAKLSPQCMKDFYGDFRKHTFPSVEMNLPSFKHYLLKYGFVPDKCGFGAGLEKDAMFKMLFKSGHNRPGDGHIDKEFGFQNLCYVVLAMDPKCKDRYARAWFLFNIYSENVPELNMSSENLKLLARDLSSKTGEKIRFEQFEALYRDNKTLQNMVRLPKSIFELLSQQENTHIEKSTSKGRSYSRGKGTCYLCKANNYSLANHLYMVNYTGSLVNEKSTAPFIDRFYPYSDYDRYSMEIAHKSDSLPNNLRSLLAQKTEIKDYNQLIIQLCRQLVPILENHPKIVKVRAPVLVIPELHGQFDYLRALEKEFMPLHPGLENSVVFMGNYIGTKDKNSKVLDLIVYLFATKLLDVNRVILLRGAQECGRTIHKLTKECKLRFGKASELVIDALMSVFEQLPYVALINEMICCIPSGIPREATNTSLFQLFETMQKSSQTTVRDTLSYFCKSKTYDELNDLERRSSGNVVSSIGSNGRLFRYRNNAARAASQFPKFPTSKKCSKQTKSAQKCPTSRIGHLKTNSMGKLVVPQRSMIVFDENMFYPFITINQLAYVVRNGEAPDGYRLMFGQKCITLGASYHRNTTLTGLLLINGTLNMKLIKYKYCKKEEDEGLTKHESYVEL